MLKRIQKWIDHKKYRIETYGWFDAFIHEPWEDLVEIPLWKTWRMIQWVPKLWNIMDFEGTELLKVMDYQLSRNQKVLKEDPYHCEENSRKLSGPRYAKQVQEARDSISKILEDDFCKAEWKQHNKKYGKLRFTKKGFGRKIENAQSRKEFMKIHELAEKRKKEEYDKLFKNLKDNLECWWS